MTILELKELILIIVVGGVLLGLLLAFIINVLRTLFKNLRRK